MNVLIVHQNFPGQYRHLAPALAQLPGHRVVAMRTGQDQQWQGVQVVGYEVQPPADKPPQLLMDFGSKVLRGQALARRAWALRKSGFMPDVILVHPGWGEALFLQDIWPQARLGVFAEFYYGTSGADVGFDPEFATRQSPEDEAVRLRLKNISQELALMQASRGLSPTAWQRDQYPRSLAHKIDVIHDGIDTTAVCPDPQVRMKLNDRIWLSRDDEVITFVNRNLEPYRGYHRFVRALPELLRRRPKARVLIVGGNEVSYGSAPPQGSTWRQIFWDEVREQVDTSRVHFLGRLPYPVFVQMLQLSAVHVYLTYPFVLSWSLLEAMSAGCAIVASDTAPVREVMEDGREGWLTDFFDTEGLVERIGQALDDRQAAQGRGQAARQRVVQGYDLKAQCLPRQLDWVKSL